MILVIKYVTKTIIKYINKLFKILNCNKIIRMIIDINIGKYI